MHAGEIKVHKITVLEIFMMNAFSIRKFEIFQKYLYSQTGKKIVDNTILL